MKMIFWFSALLIFSSCENQNNNENNTMKDYFPFEIMNDDRNTIVASLESEKTFPKYYNFFKKHGYEGNGPCWEGHIIQILEKEDAELLNHIMFDPEAGGFYAYADSKSNQIRFVELLAPIFSDTTKLEKYVSVADDSRIDD